MAWLTLAAVAIQFMTSSLVVSLQARHHLLTIGGDVLSLAIAPREHAVSWWWVLALQALIVSPALAALAGVRWMRWFPLGVVPGVIANGAEALVRGSVCNALELTIGSASAMALSAGDVWVLIALAHAGASAVCRGVVAR